jgi:hypothetical protein
MHHMPTASDVDVPAQSCELGVFHDPNDTKERGCGDGELKRRVRGQSGGGVVKLERGW